MLQLTCDVTVVQLCVWPVSRWLETQTTSLSTNERLVHTRAFCQHWQCAYTVSDLTSCLQVAGHARHQPAHQRAAAAQGPHPQPRAAVRHHGVPAAGTVMD